MNVYLVELDGINMIQSDEEINKGDLIILYEDGIPNHYRVRGKYGQNLNLRLVKAVRQSKDGIKYYLDDVELLYENRLSKNQLIIAYGGMLYKVLDIEKKSNILTLEEQEHIAAWSIYGVYESRVDEGLDIHDREKNGYKAEKYFESYGKAIGYVMKERGKGRKVSL